MGDGRQSPPSSPHLEKTKKLVFWEGSRDLPAVDMTLRGRLAHGWRRKGEPLGGAASRQGKGSDCTLGALAVGVEGFDAVDHVVPEARVGVQGSL